MQQIPEQIKISTNLSGKMHDMTVITTACSNNPNCARMSAVRGSICQHCYAQRGLKTFPNARKCYEKNGKILSGALLKASQIPFVNANICRLESHGDIINETHLMNYVAICKKNPHCKFSLWTKQYSLVLDFFKRHKAPRNLTLVVSSLMINHPVDISKFKTVIRTKRFTVWSKDYLNRHPEVKINCGARSCIDCKKCYTSRVESINEIQK